MRAFLQHWAMPAAAQSSVSSLLACLPLAVAGKVHRLLAALVLGAPKCPPAPNARPFAHGHKAAEPRL